MFPLFEIPFLRPVSLVSLPSWVCRLFSGHFSTGLLLVSDPLMSAGKSPGIPVNPEADIANCLLSNSSPLLAH